jgi:hypothetical protein
MGLLSELAIARDVRAIRREDRSQAKRRLTVHRELRRLLVGDRKGRLPERLASGIAAAVHDLRTGPRYRAEVSLRWAARFAAQLEAAHREWERQGGDWSGFLERDGLVADPYVTALVDVWSRIRLSPDTRLRALALYAIGLATKRAPPGSGRLPKPLLARTAKARMALLARLREERARARKRDPVTARAVEAWVVNDPDQAAAVFAVVAEQDAAHAFDQYARARRHAKLRELPGKDHLTLEVAVADHEGRQETYLAKLAREAARARRTADEAAASQEPS